MSTTSDSPSVRSATDAAIARVLGAERDARLSIGQAGQRVAQIAESARTAARRLAERNEQRIRAVTAAFERDLAARVAEIDAEAATLVALTPPGAAELQQLTEQVQALAREWVGAPK